jgi:hypothetical protein
VTSEALTSLRNRIERDINMLDDQSKCRLQKLAKAAENAFAERALLLDENKLLFEQNNESRSRVSTRSTVIGKAKIMSYEDIVEAQRKRDAKEASLCARDSKRKSSALVRVAARRTRENELEVTENEIEVSGLGNYCSVLQF